MTVAQLLHKARLRLGDTNKIKFSDYSLLETLNYVLSLVSTALGNTTSNLISAKATLTLTDGNAELPADFQSLVSVENGWQHAPLNRSAHKGEYQLLGSRMYAEADFINILYKKQLKVGAMPDLVPLPDSFIDLLLNMIKLILSEGSSKADNDLLAIISPEVYRLAAGRERTELRQSLIFRV